jgi:PHP family Zn ribbon phosphoesterase
MKTKIIRTLKDINSLREGEIGIEKAGTFKWGVIEEEPKTRRKTRRK